MFDLSRHGWNEDRLDYLMMTMQRNEDDNDESSEEEDKVGEANREG